MAETTEMKRPRVFISATHKDLQKYRNAVIGSIDRLELNGIAMESFGAVPDSPINVCRRRVRQSQYFVLIVGHCYGSLVPMEDISFTHAEYDEAVNCGLPRFVYLIDEQVSAVGDCAGGDDANRLRDFRDLLKRYNTCDFFTDPDELAQQVEKALRRYIVDGKSHSMPEELIHEQRRVSEMIEAYRQKGHIINGFDPLTEGRGLDMVPELEHEYWKFTDCDLSNEIWTGDFGKAEYVRLDELIKRLRHTYCGSKAWEYRHIPSREQRRWLEYRIERGLEGYRLGDAERVIALERLVAGQEVEHYLQLKHPTKLRYSLEGAEALIPLLADLVETSPRYSVDTVVLGTTHRGRVNLLINLFGSSTAQVIQSTSYTARCIVNAPQGKVAIIAPEPSSEAESLAAVVHGMVRGIQDRGDREQRDKTRSIVLHGDSTFGSYGAVYENMSASQTSGFGIGGTLHIVINNQIGFTTSNPLVSRSTPHCTDIAKFLGIPVFHVNADAPDEVLAVGRLALAYTNKFKVDVVIDLACYRRRGHHELDEPTATQPLMYRMIAAHPTVIDIFEAQLRDQGRIGEQWLVEKKATMRERLESDLATTVWAECEVPASKPRCEFTKEQPRPAAENDLVRIAESLTQLPDGFRVHASLERMLHRRKMMAAGVQDWDWGLAELCAFGSLLLEGYPIRLSGKDVERGTFSQRHLRLYDADAGYGYLPLHQLGIEQARISSGVSTRADPGVLAFEYGYAASRPETLVVWEAQFPDSVSTAQGVIDQLILGTAEPHCLESHLVVLVPYGLQWKRWGHASGDLQRLLVGERTKGRICVPSTSAQLFHLYRQQMHTASRHPLIILVAPTLFRNPASFSPMKSFCSHAFRELLVTVSDEQLSKAPELVLCSGESCYHYPKRARRSGENEAPLIRIEQLRPFPQEEVARLLGGCKSLQRLFWYQDEAADRWAWTHVQKALKQSASVSLPLELLNESIG